MPKMRVAVVDHLSNPGGGSGVIRGLMTGFSNLRDRVDITYFANPAGVAREKFGEYFGRLGLAVHSLRSLRQTRFHTVRRRASGLLSRMIGRCEQDGQLVREIEQLARGFDLVYFPWPHFLDCPVLCCPSVCTLHDLNFRYFFGTHTFSDEQIATLERQTPLWLQRSTVVVSTQFMESEVRRFYPQTKTLHVIHLPSPLGPARMSEVDARAKVSDLGLAPPYILCPTHNCSHKNINVLISAFARIRKKPRNLVLVLTGNGLGVFRGKAMPIGLLRCTDGHDVCSLGYIAADEVEALMICAQAVVSPSLYEAGNGSGIDAWSRGVPVVMSDIPAFVEHIRFQGVRASVFDPMDANDLANKIEEVLCQPSKAKADALQSKVALGALTWQRAAESYLSVFKEARAAVFAAVR